MQYKLFFTFSTEIFSTSFVYILNEVENEARPKQLSFRPAFH